MVFTPGPAHAVDMDHVRTRLRRPGLAAALPALLLLGPLSSPAVAGEGDVIVRGSCSGRADWKLKASPQDGRIEIEGEVDSNRNGQTWHWRIRHNGEVSAKGRAKTAGASGSFEVRRMLVDLRGEDVIGWRAKNRASGERCRGHLRF